MIIFGIWVADTLGAHNAPPEILAHIFSYSATSAKEGLAVALVCKWWKNTIFGTVANEIWESLAKEEWPYLKLKNIKLSNWYCLYRSRLVIY